MLVTDKLIFFEISLEKKWNIINLKIYFCGSSSRGAWRGSRYIGAGRPPHVDSWPESEVCPKGWQPGKWPLRNAPCAAVRLLSSNSRRSSTGPLQRLPQKWLSPAPSNKRALPHHRSQLHQRAPSHQKAPPHQRPSKTTTTSKGAIAATTCIDRLYWPENIGKVTAQKTPGGDKTGRKDELSGSLRWKKLVKLKTCCVRFKTQRLWSRWFFFCDWKEKTLDNINFFNQVLIKKTAFKFFCIKMCWN